MTDTRKEFEQFVLDNMRTDAPNFINERRFAEKSWQACQSLYDKRVQRLLAVIAKKDSALRELRASLDPEDFMGGISMLDHIDKALAIKPENVELVEVGYVDQFGNYEHSAEPDQWTHGDTVYTIKTKE